MKKDKCVDIDECANFTHGCVGLAQCLNTDGGYECKCPDGLSGDRCDQDINECKAEKVRGLLTSDLFSESSSLSNRKLSQLINSTKVNVVNTHFSNYYLLDKAIIRLNSILTAIF